MAGEEGLILPAMLIWIIGEIRLIQHRLKKGAERMTYFNHRITGIEHTLGIESIGDPPEAPPPQAPTAQDPRAILISSPRE